MKTIRVWVGSRWKPAMKDGGKAEPKRQERGLRSRFRRPTFVSRPLELVFIRTTRVPGDTFNGPPRTDTDLMRQ